MKIHFKKLFLERCKAQSDMTMLFDFYNNNWDKVIKYAKKQRRKCKRLNKELDNIPWQQL